MKISRIATTLLILVSQSISLACFFQLYCILPVGAHGSSSTASTESSVDWKTFDPAKYRGVREQLIPWSGSKYKSTPVFPMNPGQNGIFTINVNGEEYPVGIFAHEGTSLTIWKEDKSCVSVLAPPAGAMVRVSRGTGVPGCTIYGTTDYTPINYGNYNLNKIVSVFGGLVYFCGDPKNSGQLKIFWDLNRMFFSSSTGIPRLIYLIPGESILIPRSAAPPIIAMDRVKAPDSYQSGWSKTIIVTDEKGKNHTCWLKLMPPVSHSPGKVSGTDNGIATFEGRESLPPSTQAPGPSSSASGKNASTSNLNGTKASTYQ